MKESEPIALELITEFESTKKIDGDTVMVPYPSTEQLAALTIPLITNARQGPSPAKAALKVWEECYVEILRHKSAQKRMLMDDERKRQICKEINLPKDSEFPMKLDDMLKRLSGSKQPDRLRLFRQHLREQPQFDAMGTPLVDEKGKLMLRTQDQVTELLAKLAFIKTPYQYFEIARQFNYYLTRVLPGKRAKAGAQARNTKKRAKKVL